MRLLSAFVLSAFLLLPAAAQEEEIVASLAGGRVIIHVTRDAILFGVIDHAMEAKSVPPRVATIGGSHVGIFFGASEWQVPAEPRPIRLDRNIGDLRPTSSHYYQPEGSGDPDLELIGVAFLEKLRPLAAQLHHKFDLQPGEPLFEIVLLGYAPKGYGPEVWVIEYGAEQEPVGSRAEYWQTHVLRARFTQLYPPEKHAAKTLLEVRFPADLQGIPLLGLIEQNDARIAQLRSSDARFGKLVEQIERGQASKSTTQDAADFLRATLPLLAGGANFMEGKMDEASGFDWIVPPEEPADKGQRAGEADRPADAPSLVRKPKSDPKP